MCKQALPNFILEMMGESNQLQRVMFGQKQRILQNTKYTGNAKQSNFLKKFPSRLPICPFNWSFIFTPDIWINLAGAPSKDAGNYVEES